LLNVDGEFRTGGEDGKLEILVVVLGSGCELRSQLLLCLPDEGVHSLTKPPRIPRRSVLGMTSRRRLPSRSSVGALSKGQPPSIASPTLSVTRVIKQRDPARDNRTGMPWTRHHEQKGGPFSIEKGHICTTWCNDTNIKMKGKR